MPANIFLLATSFSRLPLHPEFLNHSDYMFIRGGFGCLLTGIHEELAPEIAEKMEKKEVCTDVYLHLGMLPFRSQDPGTPPPLYLWQGRKDVSWYLSSEKQNKQCRAFPNGLLSTLSNEWCAPFST